MPSRIKFISLASLYKFYFPAAFLEIVEPSLNIARYFATL